MKFIISELPNSFKLHLTHGISRAYGYEGQNRLTLRFRENKYTNVGGNYDLLGELIAEWLNDVVVKSENVQKRLAEIFEKKESFSGDLVIKQNETGAFYILADAGLNQINYLMRSLGFDCTTEYSSNRKNRYETGIYIKNVGIA